MLSLDFSLIGPRPLKVLCIGAHSDDIEIGCGGTLLHWLAQGRPLDVTWMVTTGDAIRSAEARRSAKALLRKAGSLSLHQGSFRDGHLPAQFTDVKAWFERVRAEGSPDVVFTHRLEDRHQDHRLVAELTWNTWRDHFILEYEIPKYEGDLGQPNVYVPLTRRIVTAKARHLDRHFGSQRGKTWFTPETFAALSRLRGLECRAPDGHAEAFHARKISLSGAPPGSP
jgi:LmbE family N-acetylglucosaminyl deacetylase